MGKPKVILWKNKQTCHFCLKGKNTVGTKLKPKFLACCQNNCGFTYRD